MDYVYVLYCKEAKAYKIGYTKDPEGRFYDLQCGNPFELKKENAMILMCPEGTGRAFEKLLQKKFEHRRIKGEWFSLTDDEYLSLGWPVVATFSLEHARADEVFQVKNFVEREISQEEREALKSFKKIGKKNG